MGPRVSADTSVKNQNLGLLWFLHFPEHACVFPIHFPASHSKVVSSTPNRASPFPVICGFCDGWGGIALNVPDAVEAVRNKKQSAKYHLRNWVTLQ
jgi:hypothetical protein